MPAPKSLQLIHLEAFLDSVPNLTQIQDRIRQLEPNSTCEERESLRETLFNLVKSLLQYQVDRGRAGWASEILEFNYEANGINDVDFITTLLLDYAIERPWIIEAPFIQNAVHATGSSDTQSNLNTADICGLYDGCDTVSSLTHRHGTKRSSLEPCEPELSMQATSSLQSLDEKNILNLPRQTMDDNIVFLVDCHLGIGGVVPATSQQSAVQDGHESNIKDMPSLKLEFLQEFNNHIRFEPIECTSSGYRARVSFLPFNTEGHLDHTLIEKLFDRVLHAIRNLRSAIWHCQANGKCLLGVPLCVWRPFLDEDDAVSTKTLSFKLMEEFFELFEKSRTAYDTEMRASQQRRIIADAINLPWMIFYPGLLFSTVAAAFSRAQIIRTEQAEASVPLTALLKAIGLDVAFPGPVPWEVFLHNSSLAIQYISLAVQLSVRSYASPVEFNFLEHDVDEFVLEGIRMTDRRIYVNFQTLTCFSSMLGKDILVFGPKTYPIPRAVDIEASLRNVLSLWGPAELTTRKEVNNSSQSYGITKISISGGNLFPTGRSSGTCPLWHWERVDGHVNDPTRTQQRPKMFVDSLDINIRIGALETISPGLPSAHLCISTTTKPNIYPGSFDPIGPSHENPGCPKANEAADAERRGIMSTYMKEIGTHEPYSEYRGRDSGMQVGQHISFHTLWRQDRIPGRSVKDVFLSDEQDARELITKLDHMCGLFVSSCTKIMARARLRDLVAFVGPMLYPKLFPKLSNHDEDGSVKLTVQTLQGTDKFHEWAEKQLDCSGNALIDSKKLKDLILKVLRRLQATGIMPTGNFEVAWLSPGDCPKVIAAQSAHSWWLSIFKDSALATTFACVTPLCLETTFNKCTSKAGEITRCSFREGFVSFTLSTRLSPYQVLPGGRINQQVHGTTNLSLEVGKSYRLNSRNSNSRSVNIVANISDSFEQGYLVKIKVIGARMPEVHFILKRLVAKGDAYVIREEDNSWASSCLISGEI